ncbi:MAG: endolytic transglycosylase MltG [Treponema sp.]|jgi:UPF0755 protein|nr:endolytic transglycosylase MltG [Treponema sp.]
MRRVVKRIIGVVASLLGLVLFAALAGLAVFVYFNSPPAFLPDSMSGQEGITLEPESLSGSAMPDAVSFEVRRGESAQSVGQRLAAAGLIRSQYFWYFLCRFDKEPIKIGTYRLEVPANQLAIHRILVSGRQILVRITVPEGFTLKKTAQLLEKAGICPAEEFIAAANDAETIAFYKIPNASMEGYLYPDTYFFSPNYPAARVVRVMANTFFERLKEIDERAVSMPPEELNRLVILASIIEREYRVDEEAPAMAGVFLNRLEIGMALQSCATVEYIITEIQGRPHPDVLLTRDTEIRDPYNTYMLPGLPPGPISAPGSVALRAVFSPAENNYLYFRLVDAAGGRHYFSNTLDEHIRAGALYTKR